MGVQRLVDLGCADFFLRSLLAGRLGTSRESSPQQYRVQLFSVVVACHFVGDERRWAITVLRVPVGGIPLRETLREPKLHHPNNPNSWMCFL